MEDLIVKLLKENGRVIIPDFGALIIKTKSPFTVIFNEFLQYNDGALIGAAEKELKIGRDDAVLKVKDYVADIASKLDKGEVVNLQEIGVISKSATGKIALGKSNADKSNEILETKDKQASTVEFDIADTKTISASEKTQSVSKETEVGKTEVKERKTVPKATKTIRKPLEEKAVSPPPVRKVEKPFENKHNSEVKESMPISEYYEDNSSRNRLSIVIWAAIIIIVNGSIFFIFNDELKAFFGSKKQKVETQNISTPSIIEEIIPIQDDIEVTADDDLVIEDTSEEPYETEQSNAMFTGKKYYVVAGVFKEEDNADKLVAELKQENFNAEKFGKIGTLYAVSFDVFPTKKEADRFMFEIKKKVDSEAWIRIVD